MLYQKTKNMLYDLNPASGQVNGVQRRKATSCQAVYHSKDLLTFSAPVPHISYQGRGWLRSRQPKVTGKRSQSSFRPWLQTHSTTSSSPDHRIKTIDRPIPVSTDNTRWVPVPRASTKKGFAEGSEGLINLWCLLDSDDKIIDRIIIKQIHPGCQRYEDFSNWKDGNVGGEPGECAMAQFCLVRPSYRQQKARTRVSGIWGLQRGATMEIQTLLRVQRA